MGFVAPVMRVAPTSKKSIAAEPHSIICRAEGASLIHTNEASRRSCLCSSTVGLFQQWDET